MINHQEVPYLITEDFEFITYTKTNDIIQDIHKQFNAFKLKNCIISVLIDASSYEIVLIFKSILTFPHHAVYVPMEPPGLNDVGSASSSMDYIMNLIKNLGDGMKAVIAKEHYMKKFKDSFPNYCLWKEFKVHKAKLYIGILNEPSTKVISDEDSTTNSKCSDLAYIVHTSGTTRKGGIGKSVKVPKKSFRAHIKEIQSAFSKYIHEQTINTILFSPPTFDPSILQMEFPWITKGAVMIIKQINDPIYLFQIIDDRKFQMNTLMMTPALFCSLEHTSQHKILSGQTAIRDLILGGESFPMSLFQFGDGPWKIRVWNIYGTTECSIWASIHLVEFQKDKIEVPLGTPFEYTKIALKNTDENGIGEIWIGGRKRICLLDDEILENAPLLRFSGDLGWKDPLTNQLYYRGRKDFQIKRHGKRLDLDVINRLLLSDKDIVSVETIWIENIFAIVVFIVVDSKIASDSQDLIVSCKRKCKENLPLHSLPDSIAICESLPLTKNGKVDRKTLKEKFLRDLIGNGGNGSTSFCPRKFIQKELNVECWSNNDYFVNLGGHSILATRLIGSILVHHCIGRSCQVQNFKLQAFRKLMHDPLESFLEWLEFQMNQDHTFKLSEERQRKTYVHAYGAESQSEPKKLKKMLSGISHPTILRKSIFYENRTFSYVGSQLSTISAQQNRSSIRWKVKLGKCIDASPVVILSENVSLVMIGSHSGQFVAIRLETGDIEWDLQLPDRIDATAEIFAHDTLGYICAVGCYNGIMYFIGIESGNMLSSFQTQGEIKSTPCFHSSSRILYFGGHDGNIYGLRIEDNPINSKCVWKYDSGSPFFSSVKISDVFLVACNLAGYVFCFMVHESTPDPKLSWKIKMNAPIFSSPLIHENELVFIASVDGRFYCLNIIDGKEKWVYNFNATIYASPSLFQKGKVLISTYEPSLAILDIQSGSIFKKTSLQASSFSIPCQTSESTLVCCTIDGYCKYYDENLKLLSEIKLGELFSSPVVIRIDESTFHLVIGSRDDFVYYIE